MAIDADRPAPWTPGTVWLGVGLNLPPHRYRFQRLQHALANLRGFAPSAWSPIDSNAAQGPGVRGRFWNAVVCGQSSVPPLELLRRLKLLERRLGRRGHGDRPVDFDLLWWRDAVGWRNLRTPRLCLPHPRALARRFVMLPLLRSNLEVPEPARRSTEAWRRRASLG